MLHGPGMQGAQLPQPRDSPSVRDCQDGANELEEARMEVPFMREIQFPKPLPVPYMQDDGCSILRTGLSRAMSWVVDHGVEYEV